MNPTMPNQQPQFNQQHHNVYETVRNMLMKLQHIPGMDQVLNALNQQHVKQMKMGIGQGAGQAGQQMGQPTMPNAMPQAPSPGAYNQQLQQVQGMMPRQ